MKIFPKVSGVLWKHFQNFDDVIVHDLMQVTICESRYFGRWSELTFEISTLFDKMYLHFYLNIITKPAHSSTWCHHFAKSFVFSKDSYDFLVLSYFETPPRNKINCCKQVPGMNLVWVHKGNYRSFFSKKKEFFYLNP